MEIVRISIPRRGFMLVLSSPSGAGKTTLANLLLKSELNIKLSVSVTTRPMRPLEKDGKHYHFVNEEMFQNMVNNQQLLEHATVFGHQYGTPKTSIEKNLSYGTDVLFDIDWQGTQQLRQAMPSDLVSVFILPPSAETLHRRLRKRAQDPMHVVQNRMEKAEEEISHWAEYDYIIVNHDLEGSLTQIRSILHAERLKRCRQYGLPEFIKEIMEESSK